VPFGLENSVVDEGYALTSRFDILDACIAKLKEVESKMYYLGEGGIQAERMSRTFANVMIAEANLLAGDFQTLRTDSNAPYGDISFVDQIESDDTHKAVYARHPNWKTYYKEAQTYMRKVISGDAKGSATLITSDDRGLGNPFQRGFQYIMDMQVSPESYYEVGNQAPLQSERPYSQGRPSDGATKNAAPCKVFGGIRVIPTAYYQIWEDGDLRWDASAVVTGSDGKGSEAIVTLNSGSRLKGGIGINKWDINKMKNPYVVQCRKSGMNFCFFRVPNEMLKLAMVDVMLGETSEATSLLNQLRSRAGLGAVEGTVDEYTVIDETKRECIGEGDVKFMEMRAGKFTELAKAMRSEMKTVIAGLEADGSYTFSNGRTLSNYIWTKLVDLSGEGKAQNTYNRDDSDPALTPGWRGGYDYSTTTSSGAVVGTEHNLAIQGLFEAYMPEGATLTFKKVKASDGTEDVVTLSTDGLTMKDLTDQLNVKSAVNTSGGQELYTSVSVSCSNGWTIAPWAINMVNEQGTLWDYNMLSGIDYCSVPMIYHPLPLTTIQQSKGQITNGYGLPNDA
ncbi:MAG: RagB/SusD family nutrient uptake outer membrane protein, partial [Bacteroidales bacterium]|nr:RagB/SusD family nutrient uptake outer membrane protein [Bacteroidales bacterium]